jgi:hypothetical protein
MRSKNDDFWNFFCSLAQKTRALDTCPALQPCSLAALPCSHALCAQDMCSLALCARDTCPCLAALPCEHKTRAMKFAALGCTPKTCALPCSLGPIHHAHLSRRGLSFSASSPWARTIVHSLKAVAWSRTSEIGDSTHARSERRANPPFPACLTGAELKRKRESFESDGHYYMHMKHLKEAAEQVVRHLSCLPCPAALPCPWDPQL